MDSEASWEAINVPTDKIWQR